MILGLGKVGSCELEVVLLPVDASEEQDVGVEGECHEDSQSADVDVPLYQQSLVAEL